MAKSSVFYKNLLISYAIINKIRIMRCHFCAIFESTVRDKLEIC